MAKVTPITLESKYGALRNLVIVLYALAVIIVIVALFVMKDLFDHASSSTAFSVLICALLLSFNFVIMAQIISVFLDLEWNQRETNELLVQIIKNLPQTEEVVE